MKTHTIEVNKFKAASNTVNGLMVFKVDAIISPRQPVDGIEPTTVITMDEKNARVLMALLKAQIAEFDGKKAKSRF